MKKILSLFVLLFSLLLIYFLLSNVTISNEPIVKNDGCCETICIYYADGSPAYPCEIDIVGKPLSCNTDETGCCTICGLEEGGTYQYTISCCPHEIGLPPSFKCNGGTTEHHCITDQEKKK